jgi:hypothetical protein
MTVLIERLSHKQAAVKSRIVEGDDGGKNMFKVTLKMLTNVFIRSEKLRKQLNPYKIKSTKVFLY